MTLLFKVSMEGFLWNWFVETVASMTTFIIIKSQPKFRTRTSHILLLSTFAINKIDYHFIVTVVIYIFFSSVSYETN